MKQIYEPVKGKHIIVNTGKQHPHTNLKNCKQYFIKYEKLGSRKEKKQDESKTTTRHNFSLAKKDAST
jgi:hypothetical protein